MDYTIDRARNRGLTAPGGDLPRSLRSLEARMILVTGATGTNGGLVAQTLLRAGVPVRAMIQDHARAAALREAGAQCVIADFDRPATLAEALARVDRALLLSPVDAR